MNDYIATTQRPLDPSDHERRRRGALAACYGLILAAARRVQQEKIADGLNHAGSLASVATDSDRCNGGCDDSRPQ